LRMATSLIDYVFRTLGVEYLGRSDLAHVPDSKKMGRTERVGDAIDELVRILMADAPECDACGHKTVRTGACFRCLHCGNSMGCG
jgi:ribonucleoside-diphosphate reductase alpha chain